MTTKLRIGIIGIGFYTLRVHVPALLRSDRAEITAISRRNAEHLETIRRGLVTSRAYTDWQAMLASESLDAVLVATPHAYHRTPTEAALRRGLHVLVEKPLATTVSDARAMCQAAREAGKLLMVGYQSRYLALYQAIKYALDDGVIGVVRQIHVTVAQPTSYIGPKSPLEIRSYLESLGMPDWFVRSGIYAGDWRGDAEVAGGGMLADTGSHYLDLALWLAGSQAAEVSAIREPKSQVQVAETQMAVQLRLHSGCLVSMTLNARTPRFIQWTIVGDDGVLTTDGRQVCVHRGPDTCELPINEANKSMVEVFLSAILDGEFHSAAPEDAVHVVEVTEAAYQSAAVGKQLPLP